jgi:short chain dehydrogenase
MFELLSSRIALGSASTGIALGSIAGGVAVLLLLSPRRGVVGVPQHPPKQSAVLITGGSRGIGRSAADYLVSREYTVIVTVRTQAQVDELEIALQTTIKEHCAYSLSFWMSPTIVTLSRQWNASRRFSPGTKRACWPSLTMQA